MLETARVVVDCIQYLPSMYLSFRIIYLLYTIWYYYMQEAKMFPILRYILLHNKNNSIQFPGKIDLVASGTNNLSFSLYCLLSKNPLSLRLPQYLDLCAFYVHNLKSASEGREQSKRRRSKMCPNKWLFPRGQFDIWLKVFRVRSHS